jgi:SEC-C motif-containing protein
MSTTIDAAAPCPCRRREAKPLAFGACCGPILAGAPAPSAEALMRSRYSAFASADGDYLLASLAPESRGDFDRKSALHWATSSQWTGLDILATEAGLVGDETGVVEFVAHFTMEGETKAHRERSSFRKNPETGGWWFVDEVKTKKEPVVLGKQPGRNDPCPCGSGKKYKKCCGA